MGKMTTKELAELLNNDQAFGAKLSSTLKLHLAVESGEVERTRNYLSAFGKSKHGFDELDPGTVKEAIALMEEVGYLPAGQYRTSTFTIVKITR